MFDALFVFLPQFCLDRTAKFDGLLTFSQVVVCFALSHRTGA
jgi:hypothetical protein